MLGTVFNEKKSGGITQLLGTFVAVDCIALKYWDKHKRKLPIRGIN